MTILLLLSLLALYLWWARRELRATDRMGEEWNREHAVLDYLKDLEKHSEERDRK